MRCHFPPHKEALAFRTYDAYETHYNKAHTNRCMECARNFPSDHFLMLHIEECHDPLVAVKRDKGDHTFSCFVEDCERKCRTPQKRRLHLIDKHMYPRNYFFAVTKAGIDGRRSLLTDGHARRRSSTTSTAKDARSHRRTSTEGAAEEEPSKTQPPTDAKDKDDKMNEDGLRQESGVTGNPETGNPEAGNPETSNLDEKKTLAPGDQPDTEMEDLAGAMSSLRFVPTTIRFGHGRGRTGFSKR